MWLFKKQENKENICESVNNLYEKLLSQYPETNISDERKTYLKNIVTENGYLPYPYYKALKELTTEETLFALKIKWEQNNVMLNDKFSFEHTSVLKRNNITDSDWIKKDGHDIKLINLAGLGNTPNQAGKFIDWLKQLLILPTGNLDNNIFNTTIYLIPFHPREFGCAYLPKSSEVSNELLDTNIQNITGLDAKGQVRFFIQLSQLAGHPVIYDILPQTARFAKVILANPNLARWYDINELQQNISKKLEEIDLPDYDSEDIDVIKDIYKQGNNTGDLSEHYQNLYNLFEEKMLEYKKTFSNEMLKKKNQLKLQKRVKEVVSKIENKKIEKEEDVTKQAEIIQTLIQENLWSAPGGAWCSAGIPIYDKMSECGTYPVFKHFDYKGEDVTHFANLDCQTPYYFVNLEDGTYNEKVIDFFIGQMINIQKDYNFDGFRVDHIDHIVDKVSEKNGVPISYRAPRIVLGKLNKELKKKVPYFIALAEYMLWDQYYKEYHQHMEFDLLWGNDIVSQFDKTPEKIIEDNQYLTNYNVQQKNKLSILKTYNNQDGEFSCINQYPGQLGSNGALFKWFKYKFLPGGKFAQRPVLYVDGDESFTQRGIEHAIGQETSMEREEDFEFYEKFNAIDKFVKNNDIITNGEAQIIIQDDDGFVAWLITKEPIKTAYLVVANYKSPTEYLDNEWIVGESIYNKTISLPIDYKMVCEWILEKNTLNSVDIEKNITEFNELKNGEFRIFELTKV